MVKDLVNSEKDDEASAGLEGLGYEDGGAALKNLRLLAEAGLGPVMDRVSSSALASPGPDGALNNLERVVAELDPPAAEALAVDETALDRLIFVCGSSHFLTGVLVQRPDRLVPLFLEGGLEESKEDPSAFASEVTEFTKEAEDQDAFADALRVYRKREFLRIGSRDLLRMASLEETTRELSDLASASMDAAVDFASRELEKDYGKPLYKDPDGETREAGLAVIGMGKLGGRELNFSSDIDVIYVYSSDDGETSGVEGDDGSRISLHAYFVKLSTMVTKLISRMTPEGIVFRVDLDLRPEGGSGAMANSLRSAEQYYETWGQPWERSAMIKARPVAGDTELGSAFMEMIRPFVFRKYLDFTTIEEVKSMKEKIDLSLLRSSPDKVDVKLGRGGIREVEFVCQALQLIHGGKDETLRTRSTLETLKRLSDGGYLDEEDARTLASGYRFLRDLEHRIQIVEARQTQAIPARAPELERLARMMFFRLVTDDMGQANGTDNVGRWKRDIGEGSEEDDEGVAGKAINNVGREGRSGELGSGKEDQGEKRGAEGPTAAERFWAHYREVTGRVHDVFRSMFYKTEEEEEELKGVPEEVLVALAPATEKDQALEALATLGFRDPDSAWKNLGFLRGGPDYLKLGSRARVCLERLAPYLLFKASDSPDPDMAAAHLEAFLSAVGARTTLYSLLYENLTVTEELVLVFGSSVFLSRALIDHPESLDILLAEELARPYKSKMEIAEELSGEVEREADFEERLDALRRARSQEVFRIGINDVRRGLTTHQVAVQMTFLAEAVLETALRMAADDLAPRFGRPPEGTRFSVIGLGKLGGRELIYGSDLDIIFVYGDTEGGGATDGAKSISTHEYFVKLCQRIISVLTVRTREGIAFNVDTRLRPSGAAGPLVVTKEAFLGYHRKGTQAWERQAMVRARAAAGDLDFAKEVLSELAGIIYSRPLDPAEASEIMRIRGRMEREIAGEGKGRYNIKTGRGGLVDIEFLAQALQLAHGRERPSLRTPYTLKTLTRLKREGVIPEKKYEDLRDAYRFFRLLETRLRVVHDRPEGILREGSEELRALSRSVGFSGADPAGDLLAAYSAHAEKVRGYYLKVLEGLADGAEEGGGG